LGVKIKGSCHEEGEDTILLNLVRGGDPENKRKNVSVEFVCDRTRKKCAQSTARDSRCSSPILQIVLESGDEGGKLTGIIITPPKAKCRRGPAEKGAGDIDKRTSFDGLTS